MTLSKPIGQQKQTENVICWLIESLIFAFFFSYVFGLLKECIIIAACLSNKNFFAKPFRANFEAYKNKLAWSNDSLSDPLAFLYAYNEWRKHHEQGKFERSKTAEREWCRRKFIQPKQIKEVNLMQSTSAYLSHCWSLLSVFCGPSVHFMKYLVLCQPQP